MSIIKLIGQGTPSLSSKKIMYTKIFIFFIIFYGGEFRIIFGNTLGQNFMPLKSNDAITKGGGAVAPQYLADLLTLFQPEEGILSPPITTGPQFFTLRHH